MTRLRLRGPHSPEKLAELYAKPHDHTRWEDHIERVAVTIEMARRLVGGPVDSAADLSCGSGAILGGLEVGRTYLGDFAAGYEFHGPLEQTIAEIPVVDLYVCTETLEHVHDPDLVLRLIRAKCRALVLSTPVDAWADPNEEHYYAWSQTDVGEMLADAGFAVGEYTELDFSAAGPGSYRFGIWSCR